MNAEFEKGILKESATIFLVSAELNYGNKTYMS